MKKFKFRLEKVLQHREVVKNEKKRILSLCLIDLRDKEEKLDYYYKMLENSNFPEQGVVSVNDFFLSANFKEKLKKDIEHQKIKILDAEKKVEAAKLEYIEATKEHRTLEILKAKRGEEHKIAVAKEEENVLDEMSVQRASFNNMGFKD